MRQFGVAGSVLRPLSENVHDFPRRFDVHPLVHLPDGNLLEPEGRCPGKEGRANAIHKLLAHVCDSRELRFDSCERCGW